MKHDYMYSPYEINYEKVNECPLDGQVQHYFEIVYIISGNGQQKINGHRVPYTSGDLLLLTPNDVCSFEVEEITEFLRVAFHRNYIENNALAMENSLKLEHLLQTATTTKGCVLYNRSDKYLVKSLVDGIVRECINKSLYSKSLIEQLMNSLILLVARNIALEMPEELCETSEDKILNILQYIHTNIYDPKKIKIEKIGEAFGLSTTYVSRYFKKHTKQTLQNYIAYYRLNLIENKLLYTNLRIGEIAFELGFTDESHINRFFKKYKDVTPSQFKKDYIY
ncbi:hypothetical protein BBI00_08805 [Chryseobacterium arthrosphaerae]|uniref:HTH araC/xylS-type domain-containing protein n=2 Tax=Chryseobacterium arthrosphaerae TaxID=651561 RepID=A0A1B8ZS57_9FLAO|nr:hypothetical protein BBI00_08805 [Chryseobacterium arthrosphaerae]